MSDDKTAADTAPPIDLRPQARLVARVARGITDEQLAADTPCPAYAVRNVLGHVLHLAVAFRDAARKDLGTTTDSAPGAHDTPPDIGPGRREELPGALDELAEAWRDPDAWQGDTRAGGVPLPGAVAGAVALNELVLHGWDLARATGQAYAPADADLEACRALLVSFAAEATGPDGPFGVPVPVPPDAPLLDRVVGLSGRDPQWGAKGA